MLNSNMAMKRVYGLKIIVDHTLKLYRKFLDQTVADEFGFWSQLSIFDFIISVIMILAFKTQMPINRHGASRRVNNDCVVKKLC